MNNIAQAKRNCLYEYTIGRRQGVDPRDEFALYRQAIGVKPNSDAVRVMVYIGEPGVACYRVWMPFMELAKDPRFDIRITMIGSLSDEDLEWANVVWFQRVCVRHDPSIAIVMRRLRESGRKIVYEFDDALNVLPPTNPVHMRVAEHGLAALMEEAVGAADVAVVSTPFLGRLYSPMVRGGNVKVLPNCVDPDLWENAASHPFSKKPDMVTLGWLGSPTHTYDIKIVELVVVRLMDRHPNLWFVRGGSEAHDAFRVEITDPQGRKRAGYVDGDAIENVPADRRIVYCWEPHPFTIGKYIKMCDILLAPLVLNAFNSSKSDVKVLEGSLEGVPMVCTDIEPYAPHAGHVELVKDNDPAEWEAKIERLIVDAEYRRALGAKAREHVLTHQTIHANVGEWAAFILGLAGR